MSPEALMASARAFYEQAFTTWVEELTVALMPRASDIGGPSLSDKYLARREAEGIVRGELMDILPLFQQFAAMPDPDRYDHLVRHCDDVLDALALGSPTDFFQGKQYAPAGPPRLGGLVTVQQLLADWTGDAATKFREEYLPAMRTAAVNQFTAATVLRAGLTKDAEVWRAAWDDALEIAGVGLTAVDDAGKKKNHDYEVLTLKVVAAAAGIIGAPLSGGASVAFALGAVVAAESVDLLPDPPAAVAVSGDSVSEVVHNVRSALTTLVSSVEAYETKVAAGLDRMRQEMLADPEKCSPPAPSIVRATPLTATTSEFWGDAA
jgi:hypothetical protein